MIRATDFPETSRAWRHLVVNVRSALSIKLLMLATKIAPGDEHLSMLIAAHQHLRRTLAAIHEERDTIAPSAPGGTGPIKGEDA